MSSNLYWQPVKSNNKTFDTAIKFALRKKFGEPVNEILDGSHIAYLEGIRDGGCEDMQKVIDAILKHGEIEVEEKW